MNDGFFKINDGVLLEYTGNEKIVFIPEGVREIGKEAFLWNMNIAEAVIPQGVRSIGKAAFECCTKLTALRIPSSVTEIKDSAFAYCSNLSRLTIEDGSCLSTLGADAFLGCTTLSKVELPESVTSIGRSAFIASGVKTLTVTSPKISVSAYAVGDGTAICATRLTPSSFPSKCKPNVLRGHFTALMNRQALSDELCERYAKYIARNRSLTRLFLATVANDGRLLAFVTEYLIGIKFPTSEDCDYLLELLREDAEMLAKVMEYKKSNFGYNASAFLL